MLKVDGVRVTWDQDIGLGHGIGQDMHPFALLVVTFHTELGLTWRNQ